MSLLSVAWRGTRTATISNSTSVVFRLDDASGGDSLRHLKDNTATAWPSVDSAVCSRKGIGDDEAFSALGSSYTPRSLAVSVDESVKTSSVPRPLAHIRVWASTKAEDGYSV